MLHVYISIIKKIYSLQDRVQHENIDKGYLCYLYAVNSNNQLSKHLLRSYPTLKTNLKTEGFLSLACGENKNAIHFIHFILGILLTHIISFLRIQKFIKKFQYLTEIQQFARNVSLCARIDGIYDSVILVFLKQTNKFFLLIIILVINYILLPSV